MGRIHELQDELIERIRERDRALRKIDELRALADDIKRQRDILLFERPAPLKSGWKMPKASCPKCGAPILQVAVDTGDGWWLGFSETCDECEADFDCGAHEDEFDWPFEVETVWPSDLERVGFEVV